MVIIISKSRSNPGCQGPSPDEATVLQARNILRLAQDKLYTAAWRGEDGRLGVVPRISLPPTQLSGKLGLCSMVLYEIQIGPQTWRAKLRSARRGKSTNHLDDLPKLQHQLVIIVPLCLKWTENKWGVVCDEPRPSKVKKVRYFVFTYSLAVEYFIST